MNKKNLIELLYQTEIGPEEIATFIAVQFLMEQAGVKIVDLDPGADEVEIQWELGRYQEWLSLSEAINMINNELQSYREEVKSNALSRRDQGHIPGK